MPKLDYSEFIALKGNYQAEINRLRSVNAQLLAALRACSNCLDRAKSITVGEQWEVMSLAERAIALAESESKS